MWIRYVSNHLVFFFVNIFVDLVYKFFISMSPRGHTCVHFCDNFAYSSFYNSMDISVTFLY